MEIPFFRLIKEAKSLTESPLDGITVTFDYENIFNWTCYLLGPENSPRTTPSIILRYISLHQFSIQIFLQLDISL
jgi:hypothetical protein